MNQERRLDRLDRALADPAFVPDETEAEIDQRLATALVELHATKPDVYDELMSRAPASIRAFADRALAGT